MFFFFFNDYILCLINVPKHVYNDAKSYTLIVGSILAITATNPVMASIFRGFHKAKISLYISLTANILNVLGNAIFIFGLFSLPKLGVIGVAYSTSFAIIFRSVLSLIFMIKHLKIKPSLKIIKDFKIYLAKILKIGFPSALEGIFYNVMQLAIVAMVNLISPNAMEIRTYVLNLTMLIFLGSMALAQTNQIFVGNYIGSQKYDEAFSITNKTFIRALIISLSVSLIFNIFSQSILSLFTSDQEIIKLAKKLLLFTLIVESGRALNLVYASAFKGAGAVKFPLYTAFIFMIFVAIPLTYLLGIKLSLGLIGVWIAYAVDEVSRGLIAIYFWHKKVWLKKSIIST